MQGQKNGEGLIKWSDSSSYTGEFKNSAIHGKGNLDKLIFLFDRDIYLERR